MTLDKSTAHHGSGSTVGGDGYCAVRSPRTEASKHTNVGRNEITVILGGTVKGHTFTHYSLGPNGAAVLTSRTKCLAKRHRKAEIGA